MLKYNKGGYNMKALEILGLTLEIYEWDKSKYLPLYILNQYVINKTVINGLDCLMLTPLSELPSLSSLKNQIKKIQNIENLNIFIKLDNITKFKKENLIKNRIPFILRNEEIYLPFLATYLTNKEFAYEQFSHFTLSTQLLFIWILYQKTDRFFITEALNMLPYSNMTMTRSYRQLVKTGLFKECKDGRKIYLTTSYSKKELIEKARPYFISPIYSSGYIPKTDYSDILIKSGITALSEKTMINPDPLTVYAISKKNQNQLKLQSELIDPQEQVKVDIWEYDPLIFSNDHKTIDPLSLAISLMNENDERVEEAVEELLNTSWEDYYNRYRNI